MDMTDLYDLAALKRKYPEIADFLGQLEPSAADKKSALTQGLLASGLGILAANTGRTPGLSAIGQGALGGLQSYQANIDAARKDRQQRVQTIGGLLGMVQSMQKAKAMQDFFGGGGEQQQPPAPEPMGPPADLAPNFMGPPALPPSRPTYGGQQNAGAAPTAGMPPAAQLITALRSLNVDEGAIAAAKLASIEAGSTKPLLELYTTFGKGATSTGPMYTPGGRFIPSMLEPGIEGRIGPDGQIVAVPISNYTASRAAIKAAEAGASKASELEESNKRTLGTANINGVPVQATVEALLRGAGATARQYGWDMPQQRPLGPQPTAQQPEIPPDILRAMQQGARSGMPMRWDAQGGLVAGPEARTGPQGPTPLVGITPEQQAQRMLVPEAQKETQAMRIKQNMELRGQYITSGVNANAEQADLSRLQNLLAQPGVAQGQIADKISWLKNLGSSFHVDVEGLGAEQAAQKIGNAMALRLRNPKEGGGMPGSMSDSDREFLVRLPPNLMDSPVGRALAFDYYARINERRQQMMGMIHEHEAQGGEFDSRFIVGINKWSKENPIFGKEDAARVKSIMAQNSAKPPEQPPIQDVVDELRRRKLIR